MSVASAAEVRRRAGAGAARLDAVHGDVDVALGAGPVSIGLPGGVRSKVDAATGWGSVTSELPVENQRARGGPSISVRAHTGSGDVRLVRVAQGSPRATPVDPPGRSR